MHEGYEAKVANLMERRSLMNKKAFDAIVKDVKYELHPDFVDHERLLFKIDAVLYLAQIGSGELPIPGKTAAEMRDEIQYNISSIQILLEKEPKNNSEVVTQALERILQQLKIIK